METISQASQDTGGTPLGADSATPRRSFLATASAVAMAGGLAAGYGTFAALAGRFLFPAHRGESIWMFVAEEGRLRPGDSIRFVLPSGKPVTVARTSRTGKVEDFLALSSTCPHLGCQVRWEAQSHRFFCPCHNGTFDPSGRATGGPPGEAGQSLPRYALKLEGGLLYIEVPLEGVTTAARGEPAGTAVGIA